MINESRCGRQERGYGVRPVVEAFQLLRKPPKGSIHITDLRRLQVEETLRTSWFIRCDDLLINRRRVRFESIWLFPSTPSLDVAAVPGDANSDAADPICPSLS